jgi:ABC-type amino acid transport substrate-binding protein
VRQPVPAGSPRWGEFMRKSMIRLSLIGVLALLVVACEAVGLGGEPTATPPLSVVTPTVLSLAPDASAAARIRAQGYILAGVRYDDEPFGSVDEAGDLRGFDVDLAHEFAARWLGDENAVRFVQVTDGSLQERMETGQVDLVVGAMTRNGGVAQSMGFSAPYYYDGLALLIRASETVTDTTLISGPADLSGVAVGVVENSDTEAPLLHAVTGGAPSIVYYPDYFSAVAGLEATVVDAVVGPRRRLARFAADSGGLQLTSRFTQDGYVIGVPKRDGMFRDLVNVTLMEIIRDGTYTRLFQRWFPDASMPDLEVWSGTSRLSFANLVDTLAPAPTTIQEIEEGGYLMVGLVDDQLPFSDFDANGVAQGFEAEIARALAARWLDDVTAVQFVPYTEESGILALQTGEIDLLAGPLPHTLPREDEIDFSQTIYQGGIGLLVGAGSGIGNLIGLNGGSVAVPEDGAMAEAVQTAASRAGVAVSLQPVADVNAALAGVADGRYQAYAGWRTELLNLAYTYGGLVVLDDRLTERPIALGIRQNDAAFLDLVNFTLQTLASEGQFAALYDDWFGTDPPYGLEVWPGAPYRPLKLNRPALVAPTATP